MRFDDPYQIHKSRGALCACSERHMICQEACVLCEMRAVASSPVHINRSIFYIYDPLRPRQKAAHRSRARDDQKNQIGALSTRTRMNRKKGRNVHASHNDHDVRTKNITDMPGYRDRPLSYAIRRESTRRALQNRSKDHDSNAREPRINSNPLFLAEEARLRLNDQ